MSNLELPKDNEFIKKMLTGRFGLRAIYFEYQKSKKVADALAENEANKIKIAGEIEEKAIRDQIQLIDNMEQADRFVEYRNMYGVLTKAVPKIQYTGDETRIDPDKMKRLKDLSKEFSSEDMQEYVAGIIAGEYNQPGSYSLQTMSVIKNLSRDEIELFRKFGGMVINGEFIFGKLFDLSSDTLQMLYSKGLGYDKYLYMQELGLLTGSNSAQKVGDNSENIYNTQFYIGNKQIDLFIKKLITVSGKCMLTNTGKELFKLIDPIYDEELFLITKKEFIKQGFKEDPVQFNT